MDILNENLKKLYNGNYSSYRTSELSENIVIEKAMNNVDTMKITKDKRTVYVHSTYYPIEVSNLFVDNFLEGTNLKQTKTIILFGLGLGYELNYLVNCLDKLNYEITVLVIEPEKSVFDNYIKNNPLNESDKVNIQFIFGDKIYNKDEYLIQIVRDFEQIKIVKLQSYLEIYSVEFLKVYNIIKDLVVIGYVDRNTKFSFSSGWAEKEIGVLKTLFESANISFLKDLIKGKPAIVVAAGPSLNKNIHLLKEAKNKFFIVAVYTAYRPLQKAGIEPDLIVSMDMRQVLYDEHMKGIDVPGAFGVYTNDGIRENNKHKYNNILRIDSGYANNFLPPKFHDRLLISDYNSGTVASVAVDILVQSGANPIIMMGQDLGYENNGKTHVDGSFYDQDLKIEDEDTREFVEKGKNSYNQEERYVKGNYEDKIRTDIVMYSYIQWFNIYFEKMKSEKGTLFINATEGGAYLEYTEIMKFREVLDKYEAEADFGISEVFRKKLKENPLFVSQEEKVEMYNHIYSLYEVINSMVEITEKTKKDSYELKKLFEKSKNPSEAKVNKLIKRLDTEEAKLKSLNDKFSLLITAYFKVSYVLNRLEFSETLDETQVAIEKNAFFHKEFNKAIVPLQKCFKELIDKLNETYKFDTLG